MSNYQIESFDCPNCYEMFEDQDQLEEFVNAEAGECPKCKAKFKLYFGEYYRGKECWYANLVE